MTKEKDFFSEANEASSSWFKFTTVGDTVKGKLLTVTDKEPVGVFPAQKVYELETESGDVVNVPMSVNKKFVISAMNRAKIGQTVGFKYEGDFQNEEMKKGGLAPAKTIKVFLDASYSPMQEVIDEGKEVARDVLDEVPFN